METIFSLSSLLVMPFWFLLVFLPWWSWTRRIMQSPLVAIAPALLYAALALPMIGILLPELIRPSLSSIAALLATPTGATIGWVHFLAFDLFVGRWIYLDSKERKITAWLVSPILVLTFLLGPFGLALYLGVRYGYAVVRSQVKQTRS